MLFSLFLGYCYLKTHNVYFNYNIIEQDSKMYRVGIWKNTLKIIKFFAIIYGIGLISSLIYIIFNNNYSIILLTILAFLLSTVINIIFYLLISFLERLNYKDEDKKVITRATLIYLLLGFMCLLGYTISNIIINALSLGAITVNLAEKISYISQTSSYLFYLSYFFFSIGICFLAANLIKNNPNLGSKIKKMLFLTLIYLIINIFISVIMKHYLEILITINHNNAYQISNINFAISICFNNFLLAILIFTTFAISYKNVAHNILSLLFILLALANLIYSFTYFMLDKYVIIYNLINLVLLILTFTLSIYHLTKLKKAVI
mgnify:CR=1 FL=1